MIKNHSLVDFFTIIVKVVVNKFRIETWN